MKCRGRATIAAGSAITAPARIGCQQGSAFTAIPARAATTARGHAGITAIAGSRQAGKWIEGVERRDRNAGTAKGRAVGYVAAVGDRDRT
ncbi:hypothetical protein G7B40_042230, partial [Aetokthonos hydrillicola Thurmond2011]|nr:hypothetical protein [Aetokthonos hydrillicola Thurmond2011]